MPDDDSRAWIVAPPAMGEVSLYLELGEGAELTREQEAALSAFILRLEHRESEVAGFDSSCHPLSGCDELKCGKVICGVLVCDHLGKAVARSGGMTIFGSFGMA
jgi:hypothetical protein